MGKTFRSITASLAGDFGPTAEKVKQWIEANGGRFFRSLDSNVTHLIATKDAFRKSNPIVRDAGKIRGLKIVKLEWLEDSLLSKSRRPKRETEYLWTKKGSKVKKAITSKNKGGAGVDGHHIFTDANGFRYLVTLLRPSRDGKSKEKYVLQLYESDSKPPTYATFVNIYSCWNNRIGPPGSSRKYMGCCLPFLYQALQSQVWKTLGDEDG
ncbi:hypothetical protein AJ79_05078 [Helicocarpus griseus UAMH5409]|uniref:BRCT domain-containing protein n=1 Tax=Helicocarpus griseus UAMH5409 TaxID=1447875 RepID=A0A2B7XQT8_9EURO|nr:hypothetical protein AJ79_05078 [Helicocarpus griseus UAMH5409]